MLFIGITINNGVGLQINILYWDIKNCYIFLSLCLLLNLGYLHPDKLLTRYKINLNFVEFCLSKIYTHKKNQDSALDNNFSPR